MLTVKVLSADGLTLSTSTYHHILPCTFDKFVADHLRCVENRFPRKGYTIEAHDYIKYYNTRVQQDHPSSLLDLSKWPELELSDRRRIILLIETKNASD